MIISYQTLSSSITMARCLSLGVAFAFLTGCGAPYDNSTAILNEARVKVQKCTVLFDNDETKSPSELDPLHGAILETEVAECEEARDDFTLFYLRDGINDFQRGDFDSSITNLETAIKLNGDVAYDAYLLRGAIYAEQGENEKAIAYYSKSLALKPNYVRALFQRAELHFDMGNKEASIADYSRAIAADPDDEQLFLTRGSAYSSLHQYKQAIADFTKAIMIKPNYASAFYNRGNAYSSQHQHKQAIADYTKAIMIKPNYASAFYNRGNTYSKLNQYELAIADYTQAITIKPKDGRYYRGRSAAKRKLDDTDGAKRDCDKAIALITYPINCY